LKRLIKEGVREVRGTCLSRQIAFQSEEKIYVHIRRLTERERERERGRERNKERKK
jgi:hypothetical protein